MFDVYALKVFFQLYKECLIWIKPLYFLFKHLGTRSPRELAIWGNLFPFSLENCSPKEVDTLLPKKIII
jgi:hypothetical protein